MSAETIDGALAKDGVYRQWVQCSRKRPFRSRKHAKDTATGIKRRYGTDLGIYKCEHCGFFHLFTERGKP